MVFRSGIGLLLGIWICADSGLAQIKSKFGFDSGYWTGAHSVETTCVSGLDAALNDPHPDEVFAVKVGADSEHLSEIRQLTSLKFLYLDNTFTTNSYYLKSDGINAFFQILEELPNLEYLSVHDCKLLAYMKELKLKGLALRQFQQDPFRDNILSQTGLELLIIQDPKMTGLPEEIGGLRNLKQLEMYTLNLVALPPSIVNVDNLLALKLMSGKLKSLPENFSQLRQLKYLSITGLAYSEQMQLCPPGQYGG